MINAPNFKKSIAMFHSVSHTLPVPSFKDKISKIHSRFYFGFLIIYTATQCPYIEIELVDVYNSAYYIYNASPKYIIIIIYIYVPLV